MALIPGDAAARSRRVRWVMAAVVVSVVVADLFIQFGVIGAVIAMLVAGRSRARHLRQSPEQPEPR